MLLLVGLLIGSGIGFAVGQTLKSELKDITSTDFTEATTISPTCSCSHATARFSLTLSREARVDVAIEAQGGGTIVVLAHHRRARGVLAMAWDGRDGRGARVRDGVYRVRVRLVGLRSFLVPATITVDTQPPVVSGLSSHPALLTPGGEGDAGVLRVSLTADEPASARLAVYHVSADGSVARVWWSDPPAPLTPTQRTLFAWPVAEGTASMPAEPGSYLVGYEATDAVGNVVRVPTGFAQNELAGTIGVRVRTVEIDANGDVQTSDPATVELRRADGSPLGALVWTGTSSASKPASAGLYVERATTPVGTATGVIAIPGGAATLVVVPTYSWQMANPYDANEDGLPDLPGGAQALDRPLAGLADSDIATLVTRARKVLTASPAAGAISDQQIEDTGIPHTARTLVFVNATVWTPGLLARVQRFVQEGGKVRLVASPLDRRATRIEAILFVADGTATAILPTR